MQFPSSFPLHARLWGQQWHNQHAIRKAQLLAALQVQTGQGRAITKTWYWLSTGKHSSLTLHHHSRNLWYPRISSSSCGTRQQQFYKSIVFRALCFTFPLTFLPGRPCGGSGCHHLPQGSQGTGSIPTLGQPLSPSLCWLQPSAIRFSFKFIFLHRRAFPSMHVCVIYWVSLNFSSHFPSCQGPEIVQSLKVNRKCHAWVF